MIHRTLMAVMFSIIGIFISMQMNTPDRAELQGENQFASFPSNLYCSDAPIATEGSSWNGIKIGVSSDEDLRNLINALSRDYYFVSNTENAIGQLDFDINRDVAMELQIPAIVSACATNQTISALSISQTSVVPPRHLSDFVATYGIPDVITWVDVATARVAFWFEEGIAVNVNINYSSPDPSMSYGQILGIVYFPYQPVEEYESRWPFKRTRTSSVEYHEGGTPPPSEQNPFDFDAMIATITAEPSRTPTATFSPLIASSTPTPTP